VPDVLTRLRMGKRPRQKSVDGLGEICVGRFGVCSVEGGKGEVTKVREKDRKRKTIMQ